MAQKNIPPAELATTKSKGIVAKSGACLVFSETDQPSITISTPGGHSVVLSDAAQSVTIKDSHNNQITLGRDGITISSAKDLQLKASGAVKINGSTIDLN